MPETRDDAKLSGEMAGAGTDRVDDRLSAYLDAQLDHEQAAELERELAETPEMQAELEALRRTISLVANLPRELAPPGFDAEVARKLKRRRLLDVEALAGSLVSMPFQVLSILVVLAAAAFYMFAVLEHGPTGALERSTIAAPEGDAQGPEEPEAIPGAPSGNARNVPGP